MAPVYSYPFMPHSQLRNLYAGARVHLLPSLLRIPGLSSLEAALLDCAIVVGNLAFESEYFRRARTTAIRVTYSRFATQVAQAWNDFADEAHRRKVLADRIRRDYTWHAAAEGDRYAAYRRNRDQQHAGKRESDARTFERTPGVRLERSARGTPVARRIEAT